MGRVSYVLGNYSGVNAVSGLTLVMVLASSIPQPQGYPFTSYLPHGECTTCSASWWAQFLHLISIVFLYRGLSVHWFPFTYCLHLYPMNTQVISNPPNKRRRTNRPCAICEDDVETADGIIIRRVICAIEDGTQEEVTQIPVWTNRPAPPFDTAEELGQGTVRGDLDHPNMDEVPNDTPMTQTTKVRFHPMSMIHRCMDNECHA